MSVLSLNVVRRTIHIGFGIINHFLNIHEIIINHLNTKFYLFKIIIKLPLEDWQPSSKVPVIKFFERDNYFKNL